LQLNQAVFKETEMLPESMNCDRELEVQKRAVRT